MTQPRQFNKFSRMGARRYQDPFDHDRFNPFLKARAQARYLNQGWELTFEDWCELWPTRELWARRRRSTEYDSLCISRRDIELPWTRENTVRMDRSDHLKIGRCRKYHQDHSDLWSTAVGLDKKEIS